MITFVSKIYDIVHEIYSLKSLEYHRTVMRHIFAENSLIEERIFALLIDEGYLASMDEFYRINGVDLIS